MTVCAQYVDRVEIEDLVLSAVAEIIASVKMTCWARTRCHVSGVVNVPAAGLDGDAPQRSRVLSSRRITLLVEVLGKSATNRTERGSL